MNPLADSVKLLDRQTVFISIHPMVFSSVEDARNKILDGVFKQLETAMTHRLVKMCESGELKGTHGCRFTLKVEAFPGAGDFNLAFPEGG